MDEGEKLMGGSTTIGALDAHIAITREGKYLPAISIGLRDFIGTGWYSSEYLVGSKKFGKLELTAGIGFGRLAGRDSFKNPFADISPRFKSRDQNIYGLGGTLGTLNWFQGDSSAFFGISYELRKKTLLMAEYSPDLMLNESGYLQSESPWNLGIGYQLNDFLGVSLQYLYGIKCLSLPKLL